MKFAKQVIFFVVLCTSVAPASSGQGQPFSVTLRPPPGPIKAGAEVRVKVTTANTSDHEIRFAKGFGVPESDLEIEARDMQGKTPPITDSYRNLKQLRTSTGGSHSSYV